MSGKKRKVYFYEPYFADDDGNLHDAPADFWRTLMAHVGTLSTVQRTKRISGVKFRGATRSTASPAVEFLYIGKRRPRQDWPDYTEGDADELPLEMDGELVEPMYLLPVTGTNYVASLRSSGGPTFAAAIEWIGQILTSQGDTMTFQMRPVVRTDALVRLSESMGVVMFDLKLEAGGTVPEDAGPISTAVRELQAEGGADLSIGLRLSFGNVIPDSNTAKDIAKHVERVISGGHGIRKAVAKILEQRTDGSISKDEMQFFYDRMTEYVEVGESESQAQTPEVVMTAMGTATTSFRNNLQSILGPETPENSDEVTPDAEDPEDTGS
ncbi:RexA family abortive infection protein [Gordonia phage Sidious]|uniref:RexA family abortive infection protein n=1 Tax=Gordonia phage Sidious TaxID=2591118 RepID=A0A515MI99_9CAUD|nr:RexA family abortive infection protein [Gordonia phage Sidious]QDM56388.1 RexA family abortive infection protein [Gordonia phage Sidious]